ncbi:exocyst complex component Sec5-domain-containing protein [Phycomyces blakesleeanus]
MQTSSTHVIHDYVEDAAIMRFYGLDTLEPDVWMDISGDDPSAESTFQQFARPGNVAEAHVAPSEAEVDSQALNDADPLGIYGSVLESEPPRNLGLSQIKEKSVIMVGNKSFQPRQFLLQVHKNTSYNDLVRGEEHLRQGVDQRAEALKSLVHTNFDRFVSAKNTIDHVYEEMKSKQLNEDQDYGTGALRAALEDANTRAEQIYGPIVERRQRVDKVRSTLTILQRYKFFFNLPSSLLESIKQSKYDTAIRDYKRGKYLYQSLNGNENIGDEVVSAMSNTETFGMTDLHRKVFEKVWAEVNKIVVELQSVLLKMLADPWRSMDEQEKTINFLFDLDTTKDPAWFYLDSQYLWIVGLMKETYEAGLEKIKLAMHSLESEESSIVRSLSLKKAIAQLSSAASNNTKNDGSNINSNSSGMGGRGGSGGISSIGISASSGGGGGGGGGGSGLGNSGINNNAGVNGIVEADIRTWRAILEMVQSLSALLHRCLPDFWRLSKAFIEGKFVKKTGNSNTSNSSNVGTAGNTDMLSDLAEGGGGGGGGRRRRQGVDLGKVDQCRKMARNIVDLYSSLLSTHFGLDERVLPVRRMADDSEQTVLPSFLPPNANSIHVAEYFTRIVADLANCVNDMHGIHLAGDAFSGLTELMEKARWKFVDVLCKCWERDAKTFYMLEDWVLDPESPQCTGLLKRYYEYHKFCARSAYKMASLMAVTDDAIQQGRHDIGSDYVEKIRSSFLESTYAFLDGLVQLAFSDYVPLNERDELMLAKKRDKIDVHSMDIRILLTVSNLSFMRSTVMRKLVLLFEMAYKCSMEEDLKTLIDVVDQLDRILFNDYVKRKSLLIKDIIRQGILLSGIDWYSISKPTEVHSFVYEALMTLVMVHAQVSSVTRQLIHRALSLLLENMANDCLESFRQVERFGMGGMLQATLEIEFMHQTLSQYLTPTASETLHLIYQTLEYAYNPQQQHSGNLQSELNHVKELLVFSRKSTVVQFLCFKQNKDRR